MWVSASLHDIRCPHYVRLHSHWGAGGSRTGNWMHKPYLGQRLIHSSTAHALIFTTFTVQVPLPVSTKCKRKHLQWLYIRIFNLKNICGKKNKNNFDCCCGAVGPSEVDRAELGCRSKYRWKNRAVLRNSFLYLKYRSVFISNCYLSVCKQLALFVSTLKYIPSRLGWCICGARLNYGMCRRKVNCSWSSWLLHQMRAATAAALPLTRSKKWSGVWHFSDAP